MRHTSKTIWVIDAANSTRGGLHTPSGPHLVIRDEPKVGETVVAKLLAFPIAWGDGGTVTEYSVHCYGAGEAAIRLQSRPGHTRQLGDDGDSSKTRDITAEVCHEILCQSGECFCASVSVVDAEDEGVALRVAGWTSDTEQAAC